MAGSPFELRLEQEVNGVSLKAIVISKSPSTRFQRVNEGLSAQDAGRAGIGRAAAAVFSG